MTTAARPTFEPARGGQGRGEKDLGALSKQYSSRDLPAHTNLKYREYGQGTIDELNVRDFRRELEEKEIEHHEREREKALRGRIPVPPNKKQKLEILPAPNLDADDPVDDSEDSDDSSDDESNEILLTELAKIKKERAKQKQEKKKEEERIKMENIISGNPLLNYSTRAAKSDLRIKRGWDEDVFKNCARSEQDKKKEFNNDSLRSKFHKMSKYIK